MIYEERNYELANTLLSTLQGASKKLGLRVEEPYWIEIQRESDRAVIEHELITYMTGTKQFRHP
jgi:hypothetical protein